jgi:Ca2+/Na+ antiporter
MIKKTIMNIIITSGTAILLLALYAAAISAPFILVRSIIQIFGANILIHCGLLIIQKFENRYAILEYLLDITFMLAVVVVFGMIFNWYSTIPAWYLVVLPLLVYIFAMTTGIIRVHQDTKKINELLQKRKEKKDTASADDRSNAS